MTARPYDGPLIWNVAGLLGEGPGADRAHRVENVTIDLGEDLRLAAPINGAIRLARTNRGILATAELRAALALECGRCLREIAVPVDAAFQEEYLPLLDIGTGQPLSIEDEPEVGRLSDHHEIDLETAVREALQLSEPIAPLCRPDCPGLCVVCGARLDDGAHGHPDDDIDPRLEVLRGFRADDG